MKTNLNAFQYKLVKWNCIKVFSHSKSDNDDGDGDDDGDKEEKEEEDR